MNRVSCRIGEKRKLSRASAYVQCRQSFRCSLTQYMEPVDASGKETNIWHHWMAAHAHLKDLNSHDAKVPFPMRQLNFFYAFQ